MFTNQEQNSSSVLSGPTDLSLPSTVPGRNKPRDALLPNTLLQSLTTLQSFFSVEILETNHPALLHHLNQATPFF